VARPRLAADYSGRVTEASKSVLAELATALGSYRESMVLIGGWAPYFILERFGRPGIDFAHVGSIDVDFVIDPAIIDEEHYATIVELLLARGYGPVEGSLFQFQKIVLSPLDGQEYPVRVDFLTPQPLRGGGRSRRHRQVQIDLKARTLSGAEVALRHFFRYELRARLPAGGEAEVELLVADLVGTLALKGIAIGERYAEKDAYDIYALCAYYQEGPPSVAESIRPFVGEEPVMRGLKAIAGKFRTLEAEGPAWVSAFLGESDPEGIARLRRDAYMTVSEVVRLVGIEGGRV